MDIYTNILVALDLSDDAEKVLLKAIDIASRYQSKLTVVHIVEPLISDANFVLPVMSVEIETALKERAKTFLGELAKKYAAVKLDVAVEIGSIKGEVFRLVEEKKINLIIIGTHGRHGVARLLGSTASAILHGTPVDVLAVRVGSVD
jgi:universal stress protein A